MGKWRLKAICSTEDHEHHKHIVVDLGVHDLPDGFKPIASEWDFVSGE